MADVNENQRTASEVQSQTQSDLGQSREIEVNPEFKPQKKKR